MSNSSSSSTLNASKDQNTSDDPYCLQHYDNPGTILVCQISTGENYALYSCSMKISLFAKNKLDFNRREIMLSGEILLVTTIKN